MLISEALSIGHKQLKHAGIAEYELDSLILLQFSLQMSRTDIFLKGNEPIDEKGFRLYQKYLQRRSKREPVAYILGEWEFWSLDFEVNEHVLIPRQETEFLLETVLQHIPGLPGFKVSDETVVDLCCGSGVIAVVLAQELHCRVLALDCSAQALMVTKKNCHKHNLERDIETVCSDLFCAVDSSMKFPLVVSNPPYVRSREIKEELQPEVSEFEPKIALDGGADGLDCIRRIADQVICRLAPSGYFFMEFGADQGSDVENIFADTRGKNCYFEKIEILQDYNGRDRVLVAQINNYNQEQYGKTTY